MKFFATLFLLLLFHSGYAQQSGKPLLPRLPLSLIADNGRHIRHYTSMRTLKIHYFSNGKIVKAKGRLLVSNEYEIQLIPFTKKTIAIIPVDSIVSITPWHRKGKIRVAVAAGMGEQHSE